MNGALEVLIRTDEAADKHEVATLVGLRDPHLHTDPEGREQVARALIDWAATFGGLDVTVHGPVEPETEEL